MNLIDKELQKKPPGFLPLPFASFRTRVSNLLSELVPLISRRAQSPYTKSRVGRKRIRTRFLNMAMIGLAILGVIAGFATYAALTKTPPLGNDPNTIIWLLNVDLILLLLLAGVLAYRIVSVWSGRKRGLAGSHLHVRLVYIFSVLAATPAIFMTVFSAYFFHFGVQTWFSDKIQTAINESQAVAEAYLEEHKQVIRLDTLAMANDLNRQSTMLIGNSSALERVMRTQATLRNLSEALIFDSSGRIIARSGLTFSMEFETLPMHVMDSARDGQIVITTGGQDDRVRALIKLDGFIDSFLHVGRIVDPTVLAHLTATQEAAQSYTDLQTRYSNLQIVLIMIFVIVALILVMGAVWFGLILSRQLVSPISELVTASDRVRGGDLSARVQNFGHIEEFDHLGESFNRMTHKIEEQQNELIQANRQIDRRRRLTETVLTGVSSGVIGVDKHNKITMANLSAGELLGQECTKLSSQNITNILPELDEPLKNAYKQPQKLVQAEIPFLGIEGTRKTFLVRIVIELIGEKDTGAIITIDDITELQSAQRKAAWADVARRIAHEIKNPLTPIQLSAERLKRRYISQIKDNPEVFSQCTETIIKHVNDIGRMVNEFSSFARMPEPVLAPGQLTDIIDETVTLNKQANNQHTYTILNPDYNQESTFDAQQMRQVLNNVLQNSSDSIDMKHDQDGNDGKGAIDILIDDKDDDTVFIAVSDNGLGFPTDHDTSQLLEPYVTHKEKGTGLGLAIVKKIMEDHRGKLLLGAPEWLKSNTKWRNLNGATVVLQLLKNKNS